MNALCATAVPMAWPAGTASGKCTPPHTRDCPQSLSNSVHVAKLRVVGLAGVTPGSLREDPVALSMAHPNSSLPSNRRDVSECAAQNDADAEGYLQVAYSSGVVSEEDGYIINAEVCAASQTLLVTHHAWG